ncbi:Aste57867_13214 [Aphanomyces stellatus]|uniref:Aste57867_13214 protein n=1 Tax=Aphanomyces stellatus TaxID=120398 RepID=A0A485KXU9_9STRA|nr:hypothetical protein As57867_013165 [Aphanomyces stellatus]VFT90054.1 Aste57867_13214 [Aphanomyces stellatus]
MQAPAQDVVVEDVDMETEDEGIEDVDMDTAVDSVDSEVQTFLLQLKLQLDESDADGVQFEFESPTSVLVRCFVPLLAHSSMLPIIPLILLRVALVDGTRMDVQVLSDTHIHIPHELLEKPHPPTSNVYRVRLAPLAKNIPFVRAVPMLVSDFIRQMHSFDPQPPPVVSPPIHAPSPARSPLRPSPPRHTPAVPRRSILLPLEHVPGTLFHANDVQDNRVQPIVVGVSVSTLYLLHPGPTLMKHDFAILAQAIPLKDVARVVVKRGENKSLVLHFKAADVAAKAIFAQTSDRIVALIQTNMEKRSAKRRLDSNDAQRQPPRLAKKNSGFDMSSFFSNVEKATKDFSDKVVGGFNEVSKLLSGDSRPTLSSISQIEAEFFRRPSFGQLLAITESYKTLALDNATDDAVADQAETNLLLFVRQPQEAWAAYSNFGKYTVNVELSAVVECILGGAGLRASANLVLTN